MSFEKTKGGLSYLEQCDEITVFDIFNMFHNLCDDAEVVSHNKLEKLPCSSVPEDDLVSALMWCCKKIVRVINKNKEIISDPHYIEILNREINKLNQNIEMLETQNNETAVKMQEKQLLIEQEVLKKEQLLRKEAEAQKQLLEAEAKAKKQALEAEAKAKQQILEAEQESQKRLWNAEEEVTRQLKEREQKLRKIKSQVDDKLREKEELLSVCKRLQSSIDRGQNVNLPELLNRKEELSNQENVLKEKIARFNEDLANMKEKNNNLKEEKEALETDRILKNVDLQNLQKERDDLSRKIVSIKSQVAALRNEIKNQQADYQIEKARLDQLGGKQKELIEMIRKLREDQSELNIDVLTIRKEQEQMEYERKKREYEAQLEKLTDIHNANLEKCAQIKSQLEEEKRQQMKDLEDQKNALIEKKTADLHEIQIQQYAIEEKKKADLAEIQVKLDAIETQKAEALAEIKDKIDSIALEEQVKSDAIERGNQEIENRILQKNKKIADELERQKKLQGEFEEQSAKLNDTMKITEERKQEFKTKIVVLENKRKTLEHDLNEAYREQKKLEDWFNGIDAADQRKSLDTLQGQITILKAAKQNLDQQFGSGYFMNGDNLEAQLAEYRRYFEDTLKEVERTLADYCRKYTIVTDIIYKGGK